MYPEIGKGAVVMTNADLGSYLIKEIFQSIASEFNWPNYHQTERDAIILSSKQIDRLIGTYTAPGPFNEPVLYEISFNGNHLFAELKGFSPKLEIFAQTPDTLFSASGYTIIFTRDTTGRAIKVNLGGQIEAVGK